ncbi:hypothetical protein GUJ93_ZPchr0013g35014 [Zizania palustris]|uniref:Uncharacterized protein n=1 Tax=Zizania palustris TaxID=103762 RepID=A0A8J5X3B9_ZIZPA|nr:hypothetical protein GUJ93_ZPchr0013g35014 [Zizania palustris]
MRFLKLQFPRAARRVTAAKKVLRPVISISGGPHGTFSFATAVWQQNTTTPPFCVFNLRQQQHLMGVQRLQLSQDVSTDRPHEQ